MHLLPYGSRMAPPTVLPITVTFYRGTRSFIPPVTPRAVVATPSDPVPEGGASRQYYH
jgi:hypothetical protein